MVQAPAPAASHRARSADQPCTSAFGSLMCMADRSSACSTSASYWRASSSWISRTFRRSAANAQGYVRGELGGLSLCRLAIGQLLTHQVGCNRAAVAEVEEIAWHRSVPAARPHDRLLSRSRRPVSWRLTRPGAPADKVSARKCHCPAGPLPQRPRRPR